MQGFERAAIDKEFSALKENSLAPYQENIKAVVQAKFYPSKAPI